MRCPAVNNRHKYRLNSTTQCCESKESAGMQIDQTTAVTRAKMMHRLGIFHLHSKNSEKHAINRLPHRITCPQHLFTPASSSLLQNKPSRLNISAHYFQLPATNITQHLKRSLSLLLLRTSLSRSWEEKKIS